MTSACELRCLAEVDGNRTRRTSELVPTALKAAAPTRRADTSIAEGIGGQVRFGERAMAKSTSVRSSILLPTLKLSSENDSVADCRRFMIG